MMSLLRKIDKFLGSAEGRIVIATFIYMCMTFSICSGVYKLAKWSPELTIVLYCFTLIVNGFIITIYKYLLFLERHPGNVFSNTLFCILGPLSLIKVAYLFMCLSTLTDRASDLNIIISRRPELYRNNREINRPSSFINSLLKYQQRLRDYT